MFTRALLFTLQITIWGTSANGDSEVNDYANKEWAGLISAFYHPRCGLRLYSYLATPRIAVLGAALSGHRWHPDCHSSLPAAVTMFTAHCRWAMWLERLQTDLKEGRAYDAEAWRREVCQLCNFLGYIPTREDLRTQAM